MTYYLVIVFVLYFFLMIVLLTGWLKATRINKPLYGQPKFISIVIAARNEEAAIESLLESISYLNYPANCFELIVVDDHSTDKTSETVTRFFEAKKNENEKLILSEGKGKKDALVSGIKEANGEIIVTTDADCVVPANWLQRINEIFLDKKCLLCVGAVKIQPHDFFSTLQSLEFSSVIGTGASTLKLGFPTMCNGANLSFRKEIFEKVNGYDGNDHLASGDDQFLMQKINSAFPNSISFLSFSDSVVTTRPTNNLFEFIEQRIRWASKWSEEQWQSKLLALFVFVFQASWLLAIGWSLINPSLILFILIGAKTFLELFFLKNINRFLSLNFTLLPFFLLQFIYAPYVILVAILSQVKGFVWEGRSHR